MSLLLNIGDFPELDALVLSGIKRIKQDHSNGLRTRSAPREKIKSSLRWAVYERDDYTCKHCSSRKNLSVDHIHPVSKGGKTILENLQTLCVSCNSRKGARV